jgi:hypothetical protein
MRYACPASLCSVSPLKSIMMDKQEQNKIIATVIQSECFRAESACLGRGGFHLRPSPRLFKCLENNLVRVIFPTTVREVDEGTAVGLICLYDRTKAINVYAHAAFAGSTTNASLRSLYNPPTQAKPQPGDAGNRAILKFVAWKEAAWTKFLNDELEMGTARASELWLAAFWKALDRMYGGGNLLPDEL